MPIGGNSPIATVSDTGSAAVNHGFIRLQLITAACLLASLASRAPVAS